MYDIVYVEIFVQFLNELSKYKFKFKGTLHRKCVISTIYDLHYIESVEYNCCTLPM